MTTPFTVIVPTRDRSDTLISCLNSILAQDYENLRVVVSDNASVDRTAEVINIFSDSRIKYINTGRRVSMSHNWEFALNHVDAGWITVLGDDDGLIPGALSKVDKLIRRTGTQAIRSNGCGYQWPLISDDTFGNLSISLKRGYALLDSSRSLTEVLSGKRHYNTLPMLYSGGFVDTELIRIAKTVTGDFFKSMTPDVYSAIVFSMITKNYIYSYEPFAINGASHHSGGTAGFEKKKRARVYDPAETFWSEENIPFHEDLPLLDSGRPVRSIHAIVLEAYLQAQSFHSKDVENPLYKDHLSIILRDGGPDNIEIGEWARKFASMHGIDIHTVLRDSNRLEQDPRARVDKIAKAIDALKEISLKGRPGLPINNVYEASVLAGYIMSNKPNLAFRIGNILQRLRTKLTQRKSCDI